MKKDIESSTFYAFFYDCLSQDYKLWDSIGTIEGELNNAKNIKQKDKQHFLSIFNVVAKCLQEEDIPLDDRESIGNQLSILLVIYSMPTTHTEHLGTTSDWIEEVEKKDRRITKMFKKIIAKLRIEELSEKGIEAGSEDDEYAEQFHKLSLSLLADEIRDDVFEYTKEMLKNKEINLYDIVIEAYNATEDMYEEEFGEEGERIIQGAKIVAKAMDCVLDEYQLWDIEDRRLWGHALFVCLFSEMIDEDMSEIEYDEEIDFQMVEKMSDKLKFVASEIAKEENF